MINKPFLLYEDFNKLNWDEMPFPRKWAEGALLDKSPEPRGYLRIRAYDCAHLIDPKNPRPISISDKLIEDQGGENQVMYWFKHAFAMLEGGVFFSSAGEHKGLKDNTNDPQDETDMPAGWAYIFYGGEYTYSTHAWISSTDTLAVDPGNNLTVGVPLYPFFPTKMRFGEDGPVDITTPIDPAEIQLNDVDAQGAGNTLNKLNFIFIERTSRVAFTTTGYDLTSPSGYYDDYGAVFKNITVYQITMPASETNYIYDGKSLSEAGLFNDAALVNTKNGLHDQSHGMLLTKRYFNTIQKTNSIAINFQWSIVK